MLDPVFDHDKRFVEKLKEEIKWLKKENTMLRSTKTKLKASDDPVSKKALNAIDYCKMFQKFFKEHYGQSLHIYKWAVAGESMKKVMQAFKDDNYNESDIVSFLRWAAGQLTHTGSYMNIGYLNAIVQDYKMFHMKPVEKKVTQEIDKDKLRNILTRKYYD